MPVTRWFCLLVILILSCSAKAQIRPVAPAPDESEQQKMVANLKAWVAKNGPLFSEVTCSQPLLRNQEWVQGTAHVRSVVTVDLQAPSLQQAQNGLTANADVDGLIRELFMPEQQISFDHWAWLRGHRVAVFRYGPRNQMSRQADIYAEAKRGTVLRIVFRGFDDSAHFTHLYCR